MDALNVPTCETLPLELEVHLAGERMQQKHGLSPRSIDLIPFNLQDSDIVLWKINSYSQFGTNWKRDLSTRKIILTNYQHTEIGLQKSNLK